MIKEDIFLLNEISGSFIYRSSHLRCSMKKGVLRNFGKFKGKHLYQSLFFNKVAGRPASLLKKGLWHMCFPVNFPKFLKTPFLQNTSGGCFYIYPSLKNSERKFQNYRVLSYLNQTLIKFLTF